MQLPISAARCRTGKPCSGRHLGGELADRPRAVRRVRPDDVRLERRAGRARGRGRRSRSGRLDLRVGLAALRDCARPASAMAARPGRPQVARHALVGREHRRGRAELGAHVADRRLAGGAEGAAPGPMYSTMALVPPVTVRISATRRMTSLGAVQPPSSPVRWTPMSFGPAKLHGQAGHHLDRVGAADADGAGAEPAGVGRVRVGADDQPAGERVVLEHDLVDDAGARPPEADAVLGRPDARKS